MGSPYRADASAALYSMAESQKRNDFESLPAMAVKV
jgi:hypothetical protein